MPSVVDIVNRALVSLGATPITVLGTGGKASAQAAAIWPQVRDQVLRSHPWNAITTRVKLAALAEAPAFEYLLQYELPGDCLRVYAVNDEIWPSEGWTVEGRRILTNQPAPIEVIYLRREEDSNKYDPGLVSALAAQLAVELAPALSALPEVVERCREQAREALLEARRIDGLEEDVVENPLDSGWVAARFE